MRRRVTLGLAALRTTGVGALALLVWNPTTARRERADAPPLVLLDASLSMAGHGGRWREALDTARRLARGGVIWRFGDRVTPFDTLPPGDGTTRLAPALTAAAAREGPIAIVTDGAVSDLADVPADLLSHARVVVLARPAFFDAFVASVDGSRRVGTRDTLRLKVGYGVAGPRPERARPSALLAVTSDARPIAARRVPLPDSGIVSTELAVPADHLAPGWTALEVRLTDVADAEPRDDGRAFVLQVNPEPAVVLLAAPPDWDTRFLARTLADVARVPVRTFVDAEPGAPKWRDAATLKAVAPADVRRAAAQAALVVEAGNPAAFTAFTPTGAVLLWPLAPRQEGDWYLQPAGASPLAGDLAGLEWDSLPPLTSLAELAPALDSSTTVALGARRSKRGPARPVVLLAEPPASRPGARRRAVLAAGGLYRWAFRGGASAEAYRALVAGLTDWLLGGGAQPGERFAPAAYEVSNGTPLRWRWTGPGAPHTLVVSLTADTRARIDTLRFDAAGEAEVGLPPGAYRYAATPGPERGLVVVDAASEEWRPVAPSLTSRVAAPAGRTTGVPLRDRWWLFVLALAAFAVEWAWRRRSGLP